VQWQMADLSKVNSRSMIHIIIFLRQGSRIVFIYLHISTAFDFVLPEKNYYLN